MKHKLFMTVLLIAISSLGIFSIASEAATAPETIMLNVDFQISKCGLNSQQELMCGATPMKKDIAVALSNCSSVCEDTICRPTLCIGTWKDSNSRDGYPFEASINIYKNFSSDGSTHYYLSAGVGSTLYSNQFPLSTIEFNMTNGMVTDSIKLSGAPLLGGKDDKGTYTLYIPSLVIGPSHP
jgi:hypothetical protein